MKRLLPLAVLMLLYSCSQTKEKSMMKIQNYSAGIFTNGINTPEYTVKGDTITISSGAKSDFFNAPDGSMRTATAPLLLKELDNTKPFTFIAKVKPYFVNTYDAGTLYIFQDENSWLKFAFEMDERKKTRLVTVRTIDTSDDNNHDAITQADVYMKISSDTKNLGFYYSLDGHMWQLVRLCRNIYPSTVFIAISSQSPIGNGIDAEFTEISLIEEHIENFRLGK